MQRTDEKRRQTGAESRKPRAMMTINVIRPRMMKGTTGSRRNGVGSTCSMRCACGAADSAEPNGAVTVTSNPSAQPSPFVVALALNLLHGHNE